jgi:hypothetical protein
MNICPCGILQKKGGIHLEKKKDPLAIIPPMLRSNTFPIITDPFGSYTGLADGRHELPVQDADDL